MHLAEKSRCSIQTKSARSLIPSQLSNRLVQAQCFMLGAEWWLMNPFLPREDVTGMHNLQHNIQWWWRITPEIFNCRTRLRCCHGAQCAHIVDGDPCARYLLSACKNVDLVGMKRCLLQQDAYQCAGTLTVKTQVFEARSCNRPGWPTGWNCSSLLMLPCDFFGMWVSPGLTPHGWVPVLFLFIEFGGWPRDTRGKTQPSVQT